MVELNIFKGNIRVPTIVPTKNKEVLTIRSDVTFQNFTTSFIYDIPEAVYLGAKKADKQVYFPYGTPKSKIDKALHSAFISDTEQLPILKTLLAKFHNIKTTRHLSDDDFVELLVQYVQRIPYDDEKLARWTSDPKHKIDTRFPIEVLVDKTGICGEKSYLLAALLSLEGYDIVLFEFTKEEHMAVGIAAPPELSYANSGYAFIETTRLSLIGDSSGEYGNNQKISSKPTVYKIGNGKKRHTGLMEIYSILKVQELLEKDAVVSECSRATEQHFQEIFKRINDLKKETDELQKEINQSLSIFSVKKEIEYQQKVNECNKLVDEYNELTNSHNEKINLYTFIRDNIADKKKILKELKRKGYLK